MTPSLSLVDNDVRGHHESGQGGRPCEQSEEDQAQPVHHHRGELPVSLTQFRNINTLDGLLGSVKELFFVRWVGFAIPQYCPSLHSL